MYLLWPCFVLYIGLLIVIVVYFDPFGSIIIVPLFVIRSEFEEFESLYASNLTEAGIVIVSLTGFVLLVVIQKN